MVDLYRHQFNDYDLEKYSENCITVKQVCNKKHNNIETRKRIRN